MTKILLVEDDKSLREIYGVRLFAEGYDVVSAGDGEEALALAIKERPALIITDVMMPKISGFDMLDILRSTTETKDIKVIVMTALGSEDNRDRGERLGADKYLVKSQVGIEDVVRVVHELLGDQAGFPAPQAAPRPGAPAAPPTAPSYPPAPSMTPPAAPAQRPAMPVPPRPAATFPTAAPATVRPGMVSSPNLPAPGAPANQQQASNPNPAPIAPAQQAAQNVNEPPARRTRIIQPLSDPGQQRVDIQALVDKELAKEGGSPASTADQERQVVESQINDFANQQVPTPAPEPSQLPPVSPAPTPQPQQTPAPQPPTSSQPPTDGGTPPPPPMSPSQMPPSPPATS